MQLVVKSGSKLNNVRLFKVSNIVRFHDENIDVIKLSISYIIVASENNNKTHILTLLSKQTFVHFVSMASYWFWRIECYSVNVWLRKNEFHLLKMKRFRWMGSLRVFESNVFKTCCRNLFSRSQTDKQTNKKWRGKYSTPFHQRRHLVCKWPFSKI